MRTPIIGLMLLAASVTATGQPQVQPQLGVRTVRVLRVDGLLFKDLNRNGTLDPYEDWRRPSDARAADLVGRMTLEEKAGMMVGPSLEMGAGGTASEQPIYRVEPVRGRARGTRFARHLRSALPAAHHAVHQPREHRSPRDGDLAERRPAPRGRHTARYPGLLRDQPAQSHRRRGAVRHQRSGERVFTVAGTTGARRDTRPGARRGVRDAGCPRVRGRGHPRCVSSASGPRDGTALEPYQRDPRRGRHAGVGDAARARPRLPGQDAWTRQRGAHRQALPGRRPGDRRARLAFPVRQVLRLSREQLRVPRRALPRCD